MTKIFKQFAPAQSEICPRSQAAVVLVCLLLVTLTAQLILHSELGLVHPFGSQGSTQASSMYEKNVKLNTVRASSADKSRNVSLPVLKSRGMTAGNFGDTSLGALPPKGKAAPTARKIIQDFESGATKWKGQHPSAAELAQRYGIPATPNPNCSESPTVGYVPCTQCGMPKADTGKIPRIIFQTWKVSKLEEDICRMARTWIDTNPEFDYILFDDYSVRKMIQMEFGDRLLQAFNCLNVGAIKSDVWRILTVYLFGGIYFDLDATAKPEHPFRDWGFGNHTVITGTNQMGNPHQWGLIYTPFHPILHDAIIKTLENLANKEGSTLSISFFPYMKAFKKHAKEYRTMPGWGNFMGDRVVCITKKGKDVMLKYEEHWNKKLGMEQNWHPDCL